jgi:hypothetical protein
VVTKAKKPTLTAAAGSRKGLAVLVCERDELAAHEGRGGHDDDRQMALGAVVQPNNAA